MSEALNQNNIYRERRYELYDGKIVMMAPNPSANHHFTVSNIRQIFLTNLQGRKCRVVSESVDVHFSKKDRLAPDVMIICDRDKIKHNGVHGAPDLVVEVISPGSVKRDKGEKKNIYEKYGVKEYWLVEVEARRIEVYLLKDGKYELDNVYSIYPDYTIEVMTDDEKAEIVYEFKTSIFDDFTISLEQVFDDLI